MVAMQKGEREAMRNAALFLLLALALLACKMTWGQDYSHLYAGTDVQLPGPAPFKASDPVNTCVTLPDLSHAKMCRVTGPELSSLCPISFVATDSGGSQDIVSNIDGTKILVHCNGVNFVLGFNPQTLQVTNPSPAKIVNKCIGNPAWSRVNPNVLYCRPQSSTVVNSMTITDVTLPANVAAAFDFAMCPLASSSVRTGSVLGVGEYDQLFTSDLSFNGNQDSARYEFAYSPTSGCSTLDTQSLMGARVYLADGTSYPALNALTWKPVAANWFIHDSQSNGTWVQLTMANCIGQDCGHGDSGAVWLAGTTTLEILQSAPVSSGHGGLGKDLVYNMGNPNMVVRSITDLTHHSNAFVYPNCCQDHHPSFSHKSDSDAIIDVTGGPFIIQHPGAYYNEVVVWQNGKALRPGHTYSSGTPAAGFEGEYGIGAPNQPRTVFLFTSDMLGALGIIANADNRADVFALGLIGQ
jgi:hypothetical protein